MASPNVDDKCVDDSSDGLVVMGEDSRDASVVSEEEWKGFSRKVQFANHKNYQKFQRLVKSCRPKALRSCFSSNVASKCILHQAAIQGAYDVARVLLSFEEVDTNNVDHGKRTALHYAASEGYVNIVNLLLEKDKIHANMQDLNGNTPLHCAAKKGYASIVEKLLAAPMVDVDIKNECKETSLHLGAVAGDAKTVELLLKKANATLQDIAGNTPLHLAASCGHEVVVKMLLEVPEVDVNATNTPYKNTPLHLASRREHENVVDLLLHHQNVKVDMKNEYGKSPLYYAADTANESILKKLLATPRVDVDLPTTDHWDNILHLEGKPGDLGDFYSNLLSKDSIDLNGRSERQDETSLEVAALHLAAKSGMGSIVKMLLAKQNVNVNNVDDYMQTALHYATCGGHLDVVDILLAEPCVKAWEEDFEGNTPLHEAARIGHQTIVGRFLTPSENANVFNKKNETPLQLGASHGHAGVVKLLLEHPNVDFSSQDCEGNSPIHVAAQNGHENIVKMLLESHHRVNVNCINGVNRKTPLHLCVEESHEVVVEALLECPNVNATLVDLYGESPLHKAAVKGHGGIFEKILKTTGVDVNATNERHDTALHVVAREGHEGIVHLLLQVEELDASMRNRDGNIALHIAARHKDNSIFKKILDYGVDKTTKADAGPANVSTKRKGGVVNIKGKGGVTALHIAAEEGHDKIVLDILMCHNVEASIHDDEGFSPFLRAASKGHCDILHLLLSHGVDVNEKRGRIGMTALAYAASSGHFEVVNTLSTTSDVDPNTGSGPPLVCAAEGGHIRVVEKLLTFQGIDVDSTRLPGGPTALHHLVIKNGSEKVVKLLLDTQRINVNCQIEEDGQTALHSALSTMVSQKSNKIVKVLLRTPGINLHIKNNVGESILFPAARRDSTAILMDIFNASKLNTTCVKDKFGKTLDLNGENDEGDSIIHLATRGSYLKVIEFLLEVENDSMNNADVNKKTSPPKDAQNANENLVATFEGKTALQIAMEAKNYAVLELLTKFKSISFISEDDEGSPTLLQTVFDKEGQNSDMFKFLQRNREVECYIDAVYKDRQASVDAANAILVGAALIASVTFASWLQPPLGYATYYQEELVGTFPAPPVSYPQYAAFDHHPILQKFWICNSLSFFFAIATVISGARSVLPARTLFIKQEVLNLQRNLLITSVLLGVSMFFVLLAFAMAGITVLPPGLSYRKNIYSTIAIGGSVCIVLLGLLVKNIYELLYVVINSRIHRAVTTTVECIGLKSGAVRIWNALRDCVKRRAQSIQSND